MKAFLTTILAVAGICLLLGEGDTFAASLAIKGAAVICLTIAGLLGCGEKEEGRA